jgi:putative tryptophan/tyrosine transport system substrate-binding protein
VSSVEWRVERDMKKKITVLTLGATLLAHWVSADAQQAGKVYRVGRLSGSISSSTFGHDAVRRELRELGYIEGNNIVFDNRYAEEKPERLAALAEELVRLKVDVIIAGGPNDALTAKKATQTIPIVLQDSSSDPVALGLVDNLARPGRNVTGFYSMADVLAGKRLELIKESFPKLSRVAVLRYQKAESNEPQWKESQVAARQLGLQLHSLEVTSADKYENAFKEAVKTGSTALSVIRHRMFHTAHQKRIIELAAKYRLPAIHYREDFVEQGGLMSYGADDVESFKRVAVMVDKILKGTKPADIPVEQSSKFEFVVNLKSAKQLGITIPPDVLARANRIIR